MCVRKTADTGTPTSMQAPVHHHITNSTSSTTTTTGSTAKRKLKALRSRGSGSTKKQQQQQQAAETSSGTLVTASTSSSSSSALKKHHHQQHHGHGGASDTAKTTTGSCSTVDVDCTVKVRDDAEGHLIYRKGDVVDSRCKFIACRLLHGWDLCIKSLPYLNSFDCVWCAGSMLNGAWLIFTVWNQLSLWTDLLHRGI